MNVVVTGGTGFIGSHVVDKLVDAGHRVTVVDRRPPHRPDVLHAAVDIADVEGLVRATAGADAVFHLAAFADVNDVTADPVGATDANVLGTMKVWEACRRNGVKRAVLASTVWVYGSAVDSEGLLDEDTAFTVARAGHLYTSSKLAAELVVHSCHTLYGQEFTILRYGIPYGPRMRPTLVIPKFVSMAIAGEPITIHGDGSQHRNYVYVEDLADAHVLALQDGGANEVFNLEGRERVTVRSLVESIGAVLGRTVEVTYLEARAGDYGGADISADKAERILGWKARVPFAEGLRRYVAWYEVDAAAVTPAPTPLPAPVAEVPAETSPRRSAAAGVGLGVLAVPALAGIGSTASHAMAFAAVGAAGAVGAAVLGRHRLHRAPILATAAAALVTIWLLAQTPPTALFVAVALLLGFAVGCGSPRRNAPVWLAAGAASTVGLLALVHARDPSAFSWIAAGCLVASVMPDAAAMPVAVRAREPVSLRWTTAVAVTTAVLASWVGATSATASWFGPLTDHGSRRTGQVAITFDGDPTPVTAGVVLATLDAFEAKATFFTSARAVSAEPAVARAVMAHDQLLAEEGSGGSWIDPRQRDLARLQGTFQSAVGVCPTYFRPRNGRHSPLVAHAARSLDLHMVTWDVSVGSRRSDASAIAREVLRRARPGSIVLLRLPRDEATSTSTSADALPAILRGLQARHLEPVRLDTLLGQPGYATPC